MNPELSRETIIEQGQVEEKLKNKYSFDHLKNLIGENKTKETLDILVKGIMFNNDEKNDTTIQEGVVALRKTMLLCTST